MENQPESLAGEGDSNKEVKIADKNANVPDNTKARKEAREKELRQKVNQYLESKRAITNVETKDESKRAITNVETKDGTNLFNVVAAEQTNKNVPRKPCNHFNDFGTCKYESGHFSKAGDIRLIHICRYCHDSSGKTESHPATLCAQLKTQGGLQDLGESLNIDDLNKDIMEKGTEKELGEEIAAKLYEPKVDMIVGVVEVIGRAAAVKNFIKTQKVESAGGMMIFNGARRRTAGGTFLQLLKENPNIDQEKMVTFLNRFNGVDVAMVKRKEEMDLLLGRSSSLRQSSSLKSFVSKSFTFNSGEHGDASQENLIGMKEPNVSNLMMKPPSYERINGGMEGMKPPSYESSNGGMEGSVYIPKPRAGSVISRPGEMAQKSTDRSRLVQSTGDYGKSTPKSRLSERMEQYIGNVGTRRDGEGCNQIFSCVRKTQAPIGTRSGYRGSQTDNSIRKDRKPDSRKSKIDQIIGCLNQQKNEPVKTYLGHLNGKSSNSQINQTRRTNVYTEAKNQVPLTEGKTRVPMTTSFRNEPWLAAYHVAKQKAVHNLECGNLQSVSGISGYCGHVTNASHLATSNSQIQKLMSKMKMEGRKETGNESKEPKRKDWQLESKFELNPKAAPFNPSVALFNTSTPPPMVKLPDSSINDSRKIKGDKNALSRTKNKAKDSSQKGAKSLPRLSAEIKKYDFSIDENKCRSGADKERRKNHCPCPPYCPPCLENIRAKM